jgi:hypothetical protein
MSRRWQARGLGAAGCTLLLILSGCQSQPKVIPAPAPGPNVPLTPPAAPIPVAGNVSHMRGTIFFLKGDERLSPGALNRLKTWTTSWGIDGTWVLAYPSNPEISVELMGKRVQVLRTELQKLGVSKIDTKITPIEPAGQYDAIHVEK